MISLSHDVASEEVEVDAPKSIAPSPALRTFLLISLAVTLSTALKFQNGFVWDDIDMFASPFMHDLANAPRLFLNDTMFAVDGGSFARTAGLDTYRPITMLTLMIDVAVGGGSPWSMHLSNLLFHLAAVFVVLKLAYRLAPTSVRVFVPFCVGLFALHPALGEAHVWINGRSDVLCTLLALAALAVWLGPQKASALSGDHSRSQFLELPVSGSRQALAALFFLLALLSKEVAALVVPFAFLLALGPATLIRQHMPRRLLLALRSLLPLVGATLVYLALRMSALSGAKVAANGEHLMLAVGRLPLLLADAVLAALFPLTTSVRHLFSEYEQVGPIEHGVVFLSMTGCIYLVFRWRRRLPLFVVCALSGVLAIAPACLIVSMPGWYGLGRYLYLPIALLAIGLPELLGFMGERVPCFFRQPRVAWGLGLTLLALFALQLGRSTSNWRDSVAFYEAIIEQQPESAHGYGGLGTHLVDHGRTEEGIVLLERAVELEPGDHRWWNNLSVAFHRAHQDDLAAHVAEEGRRRFPDQPKFLYAQAIAIVNVTPEGAIPLLERFIEFAPEHAGARNLLRQLRVAFPAQASP